MEPLDRERFAATYRLLAEILEHERPADAVEDHPSFILGDLTRRIFVGTEFDPPDEILEMTAAALRAGDQKQREATATRLRSHADHLDELSDAARSDE